MIRTDASFRSTRSVMTATAGQGPRHGPNPFLDTSAAHAFLGQLRRATDGRTGDRLSTAIRAVTSARSHLAVDEVEAAIAAITLLLAEYQPSLLDGVQDEPALRDWLRQVDTDLTPGRRLAAEAALVRMEIDLDNEWYAHHEQNGSVPQVLEDLRRLRNALADAGG